jgi:hypothetical protein
MKPETQFRQVKVIPFLKTLHNTAYFPIQQMAIVGDPDFILCVRGRFVALELKSETGELSPLQKQKLGWITKKGGVSLVASPGTWESIKGILTKLNEWGNV